MCYDTDVDGCRRTDAGGAAAHVSARNAVLAGFWHPLANWPRGSFFLFPAWGPGGVVGLWGGEDKKCPASATKLADAKTPPNSAKRAATYAAAPPAVPLVAINYYTNLAHCG